jgi:hypothetical protein
VNETNSTIFIIKSMVKFVLKNKQLLVFSTKKAMHKNVDEIEARQQHVS